MPTWINTSDRLPPQKRVVNTLSEAGQERKLFLYNNIWWIEDGTMYVDYKPKSWHPIKQTPSETYLRK